jgi:mannosyltransferase
VAFDARPLHPSTRHWGVGVVIDNVTNQLRNNIEFVGYSPRFSGADKEGIRAWPSVRNCNTLIFEAVMLMGIQADVFWGTNDIIPQFPRMPSVVTVHDLLLIHYPKEQRLSRFLASRMISSVKRATKVAAVSETTANDLLSICPDLKGKIEVIHNGFGRAGNGPGSKTLESKDHGYVLMLGAHMPRKNLTLAINAVAGLREKGRKLRLVVTGDVHPCFLQEVRRHPEFVEQVGVLPKEELSRFLRNAIALVFPSKYEGFGFPLLEAMDAGCPVIALDTPISREIAGNGASLLSDDVSEWSRMIEKLISSDSLRGEMQARGFENVQRFSWERTTAMYAQLFKQVRAKQEVLLSSIG